MGLTERSLLMPGGNMWKSYCRSLTTRPLATKIATGVVGALVGDGIAQWTSHRAAAKRYRGPGRPTFQYDVARAARMAVYSGLIGTPVAHMWFGWLDLNVFPGRSHPLAALAKMLLDQAVMAPLGLALFFTTMGLLEGDTPHRAVTSMQAKMAPTLSANYALWPAANLINFAFVPNDQRILYVNIISIFWVSFLSHMASRPSSAMAAAT